MTGTYVPYFYLLFLVRRCSEVWLREKKKKERKKERQRGEFSESAKKEWLQLTGNSVSFKFSCYNLVVSNCFYYAPSEFSMCTIGDFVTLNSCLWQQKVIQQDVYHSLWQFQLIGNKDYIKGCVCIRHGLYRLHIVRRTSVELWPQFLEFSISLQ